MKFKNKNLWLLCLGIFGVGMILVGCDFNLLFAVGSLSKAQTLPTSGMILSLEMALFMEAFCSIHSSAFVLMPLSKIFFKKNYRTAFMVLFIIRAVLLLGGNLITPDVAMIDFFGIFVGAFLIVPLCAILTGTKINPRSNQVIMDYDSNGETKTEPAISKALIKLDLPNADSLKKALITQYADIDRAFHVRDNSKLKELCSLAVYTDYTAKCESYDKAGVIPKIDDVDFYEVTLVGCKNYENEVIVDLDIKYTCLEYVLDKNNNIVSGSCEIHKDYTKKLSFSKKLSNDVILKCPNCGAGVNEKEEQCNYCNSILSFKIGDWILKNETLIYEGIKERE